jgi:hypothetical protein
MEVRTTEGGKWKGREGATEGLPSNNQRHRSEHQTDSTPLITQRYSYIKINVMKIVIALIKNPITSNRYKPINHIKIFL